MRIMVIDDDAPNRETLANVLSRMGHSVDTAVDGLQAIDRLAKERPDLAILDRSLPDLDARDVLWRLQGVPTILWTGAPQEGEEKWPGLLAVVLKPNVDELLAQIAKVGEASCSSRT